MLRLHRGTPGMDGHVFDIHVALSDVQKTNMAQVREAARHRTRALGFRVQSSGVRVLRACSGGSKAPGWNFLARLCPPAASAHPSERAGSAQARRGAAGQ
jgi:hypothetical protein